MSMYSHFVNQWSLLNEEQLLASQHFDELLNAADIQPSLNPARIREMAITASNAYRRALSTTAVINGTEAWKDFIMAADRLAEALPSQSSSARELRRIVNENADLLTALSDPV
jgi:hypothetical protein